MPKSIADQPASRYYFLNQFLADQSDTKKEQKSDSSSNAWYSNLKMFLATSDDDSKIQSTSSKTQKVKSSNGMYSYFSSLLADSDVIKENAQEKTQANYFSKFAQFLADPGLVDRTFGKEVPSSKTEVEQETRKIKQQVKKESSKAESKKIQQESDNEFSYKVQKRESGDGAELRTDDLLEAFGTFLKGYSAGKNTKVSAQDIKSEFKSFLKENQNEITGMFIFRSCNRRQDEIF